MVTAPDRAWEEGWPFTGRSGKGVTQTSGVPVREHLLFQRRVQRVLSAQGTLLGALKRHTGPTLKERTGILLWALANVHK